MATRRGWSSLSDSYRARLSRHGITQAKYESGASLSGARGHKATPEHPIPRNEPVPKQYRKWFNNRYKTPIKMLTTDGEKILLSVGPKARSLIASHWNAVKSSLYGLNMPRAWWWQGSYEDNLASFDDRSVRGSELNDDGSIEPAKRWKFMTEFEDIISWTYEDDASFDDIYHMAA